MGRWLREQHVQLLHLLPRLLFLLLQRLARAVRPQLGLLGLLVQLLLALLLKALGHDRLLAPHLIHHVLRHIVRPSLHQQLAGRRHGRILGAVHQHAAAPAVRARGPGASVLVQARQRLGHERRVDVDAVEPGSARGVAHADARRRSTELFFVDES